MDTVDSVMVHGKLPTCNEYIDACRLNRFKGAKMKRDAEEMIILQVLHLKAISSKIRIRFTWFEETAKRDPDNVCFAKKFILDALQKCGKLPNDNSRYICGFEDAFIYGKCQGVMIEIIE